jgi:hypothetical protein
MIKGYFVLRALLLATRIILYVISVYLQKSRFQDVNAEKYLIAAATTKMRGFKIVYLKIIG